MNVVVRCDKESFPRSGDEDLLEEDLGHVEGGDHGDEARELQDYIQVLTNIRSQYRGEDCKLLKILT